MKRLGWLLFCLPLATGAAACELPPGYEVPAAGQVARMAFTQEGVRRLAAIRDDSVQGFALAATSHDIGTARAFFA
jgi:hypothetical protein